MKVSSITGSPLQPVFIPRHHGNTLFNAAVNFAATLKRILSRIGTAIALGEKADLDAAHEFRKNQSGEK